jgi:hypothetical protein
MRRFAVLLILPALTLGMTADTSAEAGGFVCPKDASVQDTQKWVRNTPDGRGSIWCDDGATATVTVSVGQSPLVFKGGVCTSSTAGKFISIGTLISGKRKASDPRGFKTLKWKPGTGTPEAAAFSSGGKFDWGDEVKITWNGMNGSWSGGIDGMFINDEYTEVKASATFTCKRIVKTRF